MRITERFLSLLLAIAGCAAAVVLAVEVAAATFGQSPVLVPWRSSYRAGTQDSWDSSTVRLIAAAAVVCGLLLLVVVLKPRRRSRLPMTATMEGVDAALTRRSLRAALARTATDIDGVSTAKVKIGRRQAKVVGRSRLGDPAAADGLRAELDAHLSDRLNGLQLQRPPRLRTSVRARKNAEVS